MLTDVQHGFRKRRSCEVFTTETLDNIPVINESPYPSMADITITLDGVLHLLLNLKTYKACGPDGIPIRLLKETAEEVAPILLLIFRASLKQGKILKE